MYPQPDGTHTLEKGRMVNPATGAVGEYEEMWEDLLPTTTDDAKRWSVVVVLDDRVHGAKGMVVRVGGWCQGIVKVGGEVCVERWRFDKGDEEGRKGEWKRVVRLGRLFLPCSLTFEPERVREGSKVVYGDFEWWVEELFSW